MGRRGGGERRGRVGSRKIRKRGRSRRREGREEGEKDERRKGKGEGRLEGGEWGVVGWARDGRERGDEKKQIYDCCGCYS